MRFLAGFIVSMLVTMVLIPPIKQLGYRLGFVDIPNARKVHQIPIPRIGGIAMILGAMLPLLLWLDLTPAIVGYLAGAALIIIFGVLDDIYDLDFKIKLAVQIGAALLAIAIGGIQIHQFTLLHHSFELHSILGGALTSLFIVIAINAVNFADGLDGLAGGVALLSLVVLAIFGYRAGSYEIGLLSLVLIGCVLGFLLFNSHPAQIFMGDGGSQFLGYSIAVMSIYLSQSIDERLSAFLPLLIIGLPLIDFVYVVVRRTLQGNSPFLADKNHIHHRLMASGLKQYGSVFVIYAIQAMILVLALVYRNEGDTFVLFLFLVSLLTVSALMFVVERIGHMPGAQSINQFIYQPLEPIKQHEAMTELSRMARFFVVTSIPVYLIGSSMLIQGIPFAIGVLSGVIWIIALMLSPRIVANKYGGWFIRYVLYSSISIILFFTYAGDSFFKNHKILIETYYIVLAISLLITIRYSADSKLSPKPLDLLVIVSVLLLPALDGIIGVAQIYWFFATHLLVMFYGVEYVLSVYTYQGRYRPIVQAYFIPLGIILIKGIYGI